MCVRRLALAVGLWVFVHYKTTWLITHSERHTYPYTRAQLLFHLVLLTKELLGRFALFSCLMSSPNTLPDTCLSGHARSDYPTVRVPCQKINLFQIRQPRCAWGWKRGHGLNQRSSRTGTLCQLKWTRMTRGASRLTAAVNREPRDNRARSVAQSMTPRLHFSTTYLLLPLSEQKMSAAGAHTHKNKRLNINTEISDYKFNCM